MTIENSIIITRTISKIEDHMKSIGETGWIMNLEEHSVLASVYFLDTNNKVDGEKVLKMIKVLEKELGKKCKSYSIGKTVTFYLEVVE